MTYWKKIFDLDKNFKLNQEEALFWAVKNNDAELVSLLIQAGADVTACVNYAIKFASENGHTKVVKLLIDEGADVKADDNYAIKFAAANGHTEVVKLLIDEGADVKAENNYAIRRATTNDHTEVVKMLIEAGADETVVDEYTFFKEWIKNKGNFNLKFPFCFTLLNYQLKGLNDNFGVLTKKHYWFCKNKW